MKKEGKNKFKATIIVMTLVLSMVFVLTTIPTVSAEPMSTYVDVISPYWQNAVPEVNIRAIVNSGVADNITLYYRWDLDNTDWGSFIMWDGVNNPRENESNTPWAWTFNCPNGTGYYEFYSIGANYSIDEVTPGSADASCHVNYSDWNRFGYYPVGQKSDNLTNVLQGSNFTCPSNSIANNMTVWIESWESNCNMTCAIYSGDRTTLVGYTEEKNIGYYQGWVTLNFTIEPSLTKDTEYYLVIWGDYGYTRYDNNYSYNIVGKTGVTYTGSFPNNITEYSGWSSFPSRVLSIYCRYTESGPLKPVNSNPYPANKSTNIPLTPAALYINVNDAGGHLMNITFRTNESGTWRNADTNSSVGNGTYYCLNTSWMDSYSTKYWWSVNTNDGDGGWDNDTYYFTTRASYKPDAPGSFTALANNRTKITLTWTDDTVVDSTRIEWNSGEDSTWNVGDHTLLYNGSAETTTHIGLDPGQTVYYKAWSYNVTDKIWSSGVTANETTDSNSVPTASLINPAPNGTTGVNILPILNVSVSDSNSDNVSVTFYDKSHNSVIGSDTVIGGSGYATATWSGLGYNTNYKWYVKVDDSYNNSIEPDGPGGFWNFTTAANMPPYSPILVSPANGSTGLSRNPTLRVNVTDPNGGTLKVSFYRSGGTLLGTVTNVASGSSASYVWSGLSYLTNYSWYVVVNDSIYHNISETWNFTTAANMPPYSPILVSPANESTVVSRNPTLRVNVTDPNSDTLKVYFYRSGGTLLGTVTNVVSGSSASIVWSGLSYSTPYSWYVIVNDSKYNTTSTMWSFTTAANMPPSSPTLVSPTNGSTGVSTRPTLQVRVTDPNGGTLNVSFFRSGGTLLGTVSNVVNNTTASKVWSGLSYSTKYSWYVIVNDSKYNMTSSTWSFTTKPYTPPPEPTPSGDTTPPATPTNVKCTTPVNDSTPSFSWTKSTDSSGIAGYYVKIDSGTDISVGNVTNWTSSNIIADGIHTFYVKAKDASSNGNVGSYGSCSFTINTTVVGKQPIAEAGGPYTGIVDQNITFAGSKSTDSDGTIIGYRWDWTNDGTYDTDWLTTATTTHAYLLTGKYTVKLQVKDNTNATGTDTATVNIIVDTDHDDDGLSDAVEIQLGSDPYDKSDVKVIDIDGKTYYMVDTNSDGQFNAFYNPSINKSTVLQLQDGKYKVDVDGDGKLDHLYDPASGETTIYTPTEDKGFPWIYIIILAIIIVIILIIAALSKLYGKKESEEEEKKE